MTTTRITGTDGKQYDVTYTLTLNQAMLTPAALVLDNASQSATIKPAAMKPATATASVTAIAPVVVAPVPTVSTPTAPVITNVRTASSMNAVFNVANNGSTTSNHLNVFGTSAYSGATVSIYLGGVLQGATTTATGGAWSYALGVLPDGAKSITATVTPAGSTSALSSAFNFTIVPLLTNLPVAIGQNMTSGSIFKLGPDQYEVQNDNTNPNACVIVDAHTLHFTIRPQDNWQTYNRDEVSSDVIATDGQTINITYEVMLDPAYGPFADPASACCGQIHENNTTSVLSCLFAWSFGQHPPLGDSPTWQYDGGSGKYVWHDATADGINNLPRGVWHRAEIIAHPNSPSFGALKLWMNEIQYRNQSDLKASGFGPNPPYYWKFGIYRGGAGGHTETNSMFYRNMLVKYT